MSAYPDEYPQAPKGTQLWFVQQLLWRAGCKFGQNEDWQCPSHADENASLGVAQGEKGVIISCAAGCTSNEVIEALDTTWGVVLSHEPGDPAFVDKAAPGEGRSNGKKTTRERADEAVEEHGPYKRLSFSYRTPAPEEKLCRTVYRYEFEDGFKMVAQHILHKTPALYRQDLITLALIEGLPIYVMEGEKCALEFNRYADGRAVATSAPGGAGKWLPEHGELLEGAVKVVVVADNDKAGFQHAQLVWDSLDADSECSVVRSRTDGKGDDIVDHLAAGFKIKDLRPVKELRTAYEDGDKAGPLVDGELDADEFTDEIAPLSSPMVWPSPNEPLEVAIKLVNSDAFLHDDGLNTIMYWRERWHWWDEGHWYPIDRGGLHGQISALMRDKLYLSSAIQPEPKKWNPDPAKIDKVLKMLEGIVHVESDVRPGVRFSDGSERELVAMRETVLDLTPGTANFQRPPSPDYFTLSALPFEFDESATCPRWLQFLAETWPDDPESAQLLQEWFGYVLSNDTSMQKFLTLYGVPGSGKTTIQRVLEGLLSERATVAVTFSSLADTYGNADLASSKLAVIGDARWNGKDNEKVLETLLGIVGESKLSINQKYEKVVSAKATARFMIVANERPALRDSSGAVQRRLMMLECRHVPEHRDVRLYEALQAEMSGIVNWAVAGLRRLRKQGQFTVPSSTLEELEEIARGQSEIRDFVEERCVLEPSAWVSKAEFADAYREWRELNGIPYPIRTGMVGREVHAAFVNVIGQSTRGNSRVEPQVRVWTGVRIMSRNARIEPVKE